MRLNDQPIEVSSADLRNWLTRIFERDEGPRAVIETGTYLGTGTTRVVIDAWDRAIKRANDELLMWTIEANKKAFQTAKENLKNYPWIQLLNGLSVDRKEAETFIQNDWILGPEGESLDILKDADIDLRCYYGTEISQQVTGPVIDNLLPNCISAAGDRTILFVLDSAGGLGYLEFTKVKELMGDRGYYLVTDDVNHLKHYRSHQEVLANEDGRWHFIFTDGRVMLVERKAA